MSTMLYVDRLQPFWSDLDVSCCVRPLQRGLTRLPSSGDPSNEASPRYPAPWNGPSYCAVGCGGVPWRLEALFSGQRSGGGPASRSCLDPTCGGRPAPEVYENPVAAAAAGRLAHAPVSSF